MTMTVADYLSFFGCCFFFFLFLFLFFCFLTSYDDFFLLFVCVCVCVGVCVGVTPNSFCSVLDYD